MKNSGRLTTIAVVGYSCRSIAQAVAELGYKVFAIDCFADRDLQSIASCIGLPNWPQGIIEAIDACRADCVLLAGGMENLPSIVSQLRDRGLVHGLAADSLAKLRSFQFWIDASKAAGVHFPPVQMVPPDTLEIGGWLWKPSRSGGGVGIELGQHLSSGIDRDSNRGYWEKFVAGRSIGVTCLLAAAGSLVLGATESIPFSVWPGPSPMAYRGSMGPIFLTIQQHTAIVRLANYIHSQTKCIGWMQFDFVEAESGQLWLLEINPRWTAGMEILRVSGLANPVAEHLSACNLSEPKSCSTDNRQQWALHTWIGKAVYYAPQNLEYCQRCEAILEQRWQDLPQSRNWLKNATIELVDIPSGPQTIRSGQPVLTIRAGVAISDIPDWQQARHKLLAILDRCRVELDSLKCQH